VFTRLVVTSNRVKIGDRAGDINSNGYRRVRAEGKRYLGHRLAFFYMHGRWPDKQVDHKEHNRSSCRIADLREANSGQNTANTRIRKNNSSGFKGVFWDKRRNKYSARITFRGRYTHLKYCDTAEEAARCYDYVARRVFGEFALTNKAMRLLGRTVSPSDITPAMPRSPTPPNMCG